MAKEKIKLYFDAEPETNETLEATAEKELRSKANITTVVMKEWAQGQFEDKTSIKPTKPQAGSDNQQ